MKKILCLGLLVLTGCGGYVSSESGSENIVRFNSQPKNCTYLYDMNTTVSVYDEADAYRYLENSIAKQSKPGNAYWVESMEKKQNPGIVFGPEKSFVFKAKVYDCVAK